MCVHKKGKKTHYQSQGSGHGTSNDDILDDEEESMDWWTKYFASVDAMIEVIRTRSLFLAADKGQLISKGHFGFFNSPKKRTKKFCPSRLGQKFEFSSLFFGRIGDTQKTFRN